MTDSSNGTQAVTIADSAARVALDLALRITREWLRRALPGPVTTR